MGLPDGIIDEVTLDLFGSPDIEVDISREGSYIAYTEDYDLWFADRFRVNALGKEFYVWVKDDDWGIIEKDRPNARN